MSQLHDDHPTTADLLKRDGLRKLLFGQVCEPNKLPLVLDRKSVV